LDEAELTKVNGYLVQSAPPENPPSDIAAGRKPANK
jgi:hypothetical protein